MIAKPSKTRIIKDSNFSKRAAFVPPSARVRQLVGQLVLILRERVYSCGEIVHTLGNFRKLFGITQ